MKISILCPDLSHNCLGRAYLLAKLIQRHYEVELVGPRFKSEIWRPLSGDKSIIYKSIEVRNRFISYWHLKELIKKIEGDIIYCSKPLLTSFGIGLLKKLFEHKLLLLDIDDWDFGFVKQYYKSLSFPRQLAYLTISLISFHDISSYWNNLFFEKLINIADQITVSNRFLQRKFGGEIIWHARDTKVFDPQRFDKNQIKKKYCIEKNKKIVMFLGTPRPHKGIEDLIEALTLTKIKNILLIIAGMGKDTYCKSLMEKINRVLPHRVKFFGLQPFENVPEFLAMADVVVIPQRKNFASVGQLPAKVFDAMAMAKPIIATNVNDLPYVLNGCGWIVEAEKPEQLATAIDDILNNLDEAEKIGWKARQKCIQQYSWNAVEKVLTAVLQKVGT